MEEYIQVSAKTKSEAITKRLLSWELPVMNWIIIVISEGSSGFLV